AAALAAHGQRLQAGEQRLQAALAHQLARGHQDLRPLAQRLQRAARVSLQGQAQRLAAAQQRLQALDPQQVLRRGYAWVEGEDGRPLLSARALTPGQVVSAVWADGRARAQVLDIDAGPPRG
ncbi:MAG: exodeoxyribonuclease VII large subunit, partial [Rubrivivax sp.]|nr:exodeoxyribonuclease VII large subunit [Rubrivivax sp.]